MTSPDTLLLDHLFQPLADRLVPLASCLRLARLCFALLPAAYGLTALHMALHGDPAGSVMVGLGTLAVAASLAQTRALIRRTEQRIRPGVFNPLAITFLLPRLGILLIFGGLLAFQLLRPDLSEPEWYLGIAAHLLWIGGAYLASCQLRHPPPRRSVSFSALPQAA